MHVYHYAPYEPSAFRRLMGAHGTREDEIDVLLRGDVFVDLYRVVRQAVRVSTESYGLKQIEKLYFTRPGGAVMDAGSSIITYERYLADHDPALLDEIAAYNRDDCESLIGLQRWLETQRTEAEALYGPITRPSPPEPAPEDANPASAPRSLRGCSTASPTTTRSAPPRCRAATYLRICSSGTGGKRSPRGGAFFDRLNYEAEQFTDDSECIGGLELDEIVGTVKRSTVYRMRFEPQDHKFSVGCRSVRPGHRQGRRNDHCDRRGGNARVQTRRGRNNDPLPARSCPEVRSTPICSAPRSAPSPNQSPIMGSQVPAHTKRFAICSSGARRAFPPPGSTLRAPDEEVLDSARRLALTLDGGCLAIQGPPGAARPSPARA